MVSVASVAMLCYLVMVDANRNNLGNNKKYRNIFAAPHRLKLHCCIVIYGHINAFHRQMYNCIL